TPSRAPRRALHKRFQATGVGPTPTNLEPETLGLSSSPSTPNQTRRRFGGRHPLCGSGVTSFTRLIFKPAAASARSAASRPEPGPVTRTTAERIPFSIACRAASSDATCAANGVDLREPRKPFAPADDHEIVLPAMSVIVIIVLLNDALMCTTPF